MAEIRHQVPGVSEEVESAEIYIPDDSDVGSGEFTVTLKPDVLPVSKVFWSTIIHPPKLQITATFDPNMIVLVQLGPTDQLDRKNFRIPVSAEPQQKHILKIHFSKWKLSDAFFDNVSIVSVI